MLTICVQEMREKLKEMKIITKVIKVDRDFKGIQYLVVLLQMEVNSFFGIAIIWRNTFCPNQKKTN